MDLLGNLTEKDCNADRLLFEKGEVVEFVVIEPRADETKGHIYIQSKVVSGLHAGKDHTVMIAGGEHEASRKRRAQFFFRSGFWTAEELAAKTYKLSKMVGRKFQGKASKVTEKDGQSFQNIDDIKDLGPAEAGAGTQQLQY